LVNVDRCLSLHGRANSYWFGFGWENAGDASVEIKNTSLKMNQEANASVLNFIRL
jgi:hypothetical protein